MAKLHLVSHKNANKMQKQTLSMTSWYAVYTQPRAEKKVHGKLAQIGLEAFLPVRSVMRQWSDRVKRIEEPLFANYVFVKTTPEKRFEVLFIRELIRFIAFEGMPIPIRDSEIEAIRRVLTRSMAVCNETYRHKAGDKVKIDQGDFTGVEGYVVRQNGQAKRVVQIEALQQAISVELPAGFVAALA